MPTYDHAEFLHRQRQEWSELIDISKKLLQLSQCGNWQQVDELSLHRETMLENFFSKGVAQEFIKSVQEGIEEIRKTDEEIVRMVKKNRTELADEISKLTIKRKHVKDYISNSR
ncbi:MAG: hypothetical protein Q8L20_00855 [Gammaproteobacteria bacterium]|nr:hypothetical protein [Gammaproteobacteria bacterium]